MEFQFEYFSARLHIINSKIIPKICNVTRRNIAENLDKIRNPLSLCRLHFHEYDLFCSFAFNFTQEATISERVIFRNFNFGSGSRTQQQQQLPKILTLLISKKWFYSPKSVFNFNIKKFRICAGKCLKIEFSYNCKISCQIFGKDSKLFQWNLEESKILKKKVSMNIKS